VIDLSKHLNRKQSRHLPAFILLFLRKQKLYGSQILEIFQTIKPNSMQVDGGGIYRVLRELEEEGFVSSEWITEGEGRPKRIYEINESGLQELDKWYEDILGRKQMLDYFIEKYEEGQKGDGNE
jgi:DNA-binding PadR family transcriptional regulator